MAGTVLHKTDVILFLGFSSVSSASDFNDVVEAFSYDELPYVGGAAPRTNVVGRVFTSNKSHPDHRRFPSNTKWLRASKLRMKLEWTNDGLKTVMGPIPTIKFDETRKSKIWFNSMVAAYTSWEDARNDPMKVVTFGDGTPLPTNVIHDCLKILEEESVVVP